MTPRFLFLVHTQVRDRLHSVGNGTREARGKYGIVCTQSVTEPTFATLRPTCGLVSLCCGFLSFVGCSAFRFFVRPLVCFAKAKGES